jgi:hypothetical protein
VLSKKKKRKEAMDPETNPFFFRMEDNSVIMLEMIQRGVIPEVMSEDVVLLDPFINGSEPLCNAKGASGAIYEHLSITGLEELKSNFVVGAAKFHQYPRGKVIHVASPNLNEHPNHQNAQAILRTAYLHV